MCGLHISVVPLDPLHPQSLYGPRHIHSTNQQMYKDTNDGEITKYGLILTSYMQVQLHTTPTVQKVVH